LKKKTKAIIAAAAAVILICAVTGGYIMFGKKSAKPVPVTGYESVSLRESTMRGIYEYEIINKGDTSEVSYYAMYYSGGKEEKRLKERAQCETAAVIEILNEINICSWNGFHGAHPKLVKDGTMFTLKAKVNGETVSAEGSANFPDNYRLLTDWIYETLRNSEITESETQENSNEQAD
jgi:hypothetical protein